MPLFSSLNLWLFALVHSWVGQSLVLDTVSIFLADFVQYVIAGVFLVLLFRKTNQLKNRVMVLVATVAAVIARLLVKPLILFFIAEPRPFIYVHFTPLVSAAAGEELQSFPSGHALFFFALATTVFCFQKKLGSYLFGVAILMGFARVYVGVHWPFDIVWGGVLGMTVGLVVYFGYLRKRQSIEKFVSTLGNWLPF
jgi:undecaprenyl-diphosphatase